MDAGAPDSVGGAAPDARRSSAVLFGAELRSRREAAGWSRAELAAASGISRRFVHKLEAGERQPSLETVLRVCRALGVGAGEVVDAVSMRWEVEP